MNIRTIKAQFPGTCSFCHEPFAKGDMFQYNYEFKVGYHAGCPIVTTPLLQRVLSTPVIQTPLPMIETHRDDITSAPLKTLDAQAHLLPQVIDLFDGRFSIEYVLKNGTRRHIVVWIKTRKKGQYVGSRWIRVHFGQHKGTEYVHCAFITVEGKLVFLRSFTQDPELDAERKAAAIAAVQVLVTGKENAQYAMNYAKMSQRCWHCEKVLTNIRTLHDIEKNGGMGPVCVKKYPKLVDRVRDACRQGQPSVITLSL